MQKYIFSSLKIKKEIFIIEFHVSVHDALFFIYKKLLFAETDWCMCEPMAPEKHTCACGGGDGE